MTSGIRCPGAIYTALERLAGRGFVYAEIGDSTPARGGRRRKLYRLETAGAEALRRSFSALTQMAEGMETELEAMAGANRRGGRR